ncbi:Trafficking protein particle complex subunit 2 [Cichlidogyrus casuarinus]|uniref:Trafficking protein particle complex subunit 2 n=1 Tax=Cichlidogyrus casuarinus TaxID=1844966 RepID=A0ABD2PZW3_9PLAT
MSTSTGYVYFVIVTPNDNPIFEMSYSLVSSGDKILTPDHNDQFRAFASLDQINEKLRFSETPYLKNVDKFNEWFVNAFISPAREYKTYPIDFEGLKFILLHSGLADDKIKSFFYDSYETYIKYSINPFYKHGGEINSPSFSKRILDIAQKYL